ncbi:hypothetical protein TorRG33x02_125700 [Trema orientale]|uniref:Uncharacterized protein n=1 Tax=Trema orientale TaxID=63057 RepID=A0A2P5F170_TREOI|nr:hypothetical protein TorRG33x02_125700 [Trema orientale]
MIFLAAEIQKNPNKESPLKPNSRQFKFSELVSITNNFSFLI